jgi:hypothetical protein
MEYVDAYYALQTQIRYYGQVPETVVKENGVVWGETVLFAVDSSGFDVAPISAEEPLNLHRRKEPVHERLANMGLDLDSIYVFTKLWGFFVGNVDMARGHFYTQPHHVQPFQNLLRRAWAGEDKALAEMASDIVARVDLRPNGVDIAVVDLWSLVRLLFLRDHAVGRTGVCANKDCLSPYFLQTRKGQKFCSHKCAVLMNVRRFRERQAKLMSQPNERVKK